jgi:tetratricopeptide (TPR) repeat protein
MQAIVLNTRYALRFFLALAIAFAFFTPVYADAAADKKAIDPLFIQLKNAPDAATARTIVSQIWYHWFTPSDPALASRMRVVLAAREAGDLTEAIQLADDLIKDYPDYAEGWNQRATMNYMAHEFDASLADIEKTLALEPRHFGALSGRAMIYLAQNKRALALKDIIAALAINPFLAEKSLFPELMQDITRI